MVEHLKDPATAELSQEEMTREMSRGVTSQENTGQETAKKKSKKKKNKKSKTGTAHPKKEEGGEEEQKKGLLSGKMFIGVFVVLFLFLGVLLQIVIVRPRLGTRDESG